MALNEQTAGLPPELAALQAEAAQIEAETAPPATDAAGNLLPTSTDYLDDAKGLVNIVAEGMAAFWPSTGAILSPEARERIAKAASPVMEKYGFTLAAFFGRWGAEIGLGFALAQVAIPITKAISADRAKDRAEEKAATAAPGAGGIPSPEQYQSATATTAAASLFAKA